MNKQYYIYETTNDVNGKKYIGLHYGREDDNYLGSGKLILKAIEKYGKDHFHKKILKICDSLEEAKAKEITFINETNAVEDPTYYNLVPGGNVPPIRRGKDHYLYGKHHSEKTKKKISEAAKKRGFKPTSEMRQAASERWKGEKNPKWHNGDSIKGEKNPFYGKHHSEETREKLSELAKQRTGEKSPRWGTHWGQEMKDYFSGLYGASVVGINCETSEKVNFTSKIRAVQSFGLSKGAIATLNKRILDKKPYHGYIWYLKEEIEDNG